MIPVILSTVARVAPSLAGSTGTAAASTSSAGLSSSLQASFEAMKGAGSASSYLQKLDLGSKGSQFANMMSKANEASQAKQFADLFGGRGGNPTPSMGGGITPPNPGGGPSSWTTFTPPPPPDIPSGGGSGGGGGNGGRGGGGGGSPPSLPSGGGGLPSPSSIGNDWKDKFDQLGNWSEKAAQGVGMLAKNDWRGLMESATAVPPGIKKMIGALDDATEAMIARGKELKGLDANLAYASAQADQRKLMADLREANRTGESVGNLIDTKSRFETSIQDAFTPIKDGVAKLLNLLLTLVEKTGALEALQVTGELIGAAISNISDFVSGDWDKIVERMLEDLPERIADAITGRNKKKSDEELFENIWKNSSKLNEWEGIRGETPRVGDGRMGLSLFDGV